MAINFFYRGDARRYGTRYLLISLNDPSLESPSRARILRGSIESDFETRLTSIITRGTLAELAAEAQRKSHECNYSDKLIPHDGEYRILHVYYIHIYILNRRVHAIRSMRK